jgi:hypothetical protein
MKALKIKIKLNYIQTFSLFLVENKLRLYYKKPVNIVSIVCFRNHKNARLHSVGEM